ncbi:MAG: MBL fold metallo-hydrolase [Candidatus Kapaibacterium sp.]
MKIVKFTLLITGISILLSSCCTFSGSEYEGPESGHFNGEEFVNYDDTKKHSLWDLMGWFITRQRPQWHPWIESEPGPAPPESVEDGSLRVTHINHSTLLLQADGVNILTDPVYSDRVSPVFFAGPVRKRPPGIRLEDLPRIDLVVISHNHYDHMDISTLKKIDEKWQPVIVAGLGNKDYLIEQGMTNVLELDWWQSHTVKGMDYSFVPARHFSNRGICDRNKTLWGGFVFETKGGPVYFAGDTGYGIHFRELNERYGKFRFSMIPIGAYIPRWFMYPVHVSPVEAVMAHRDLQSVLSMGIHFGSFQQADDMRLQPVYDLRDELIKQGISLNEFIIPALGKGVMIEPLAN